MITKKLYGEELDKELAKRDQAREDRLNQKLTLREASKVIGAKMGLSPLEYIEWERGVDVCPHEKYEKTICGFHEPFILVETCTKCRNTKIIKKIEDKDWDEKNEVMKEAFKNTQEACKRGAEKMKEFKNGFKK